MGQGKQAVARVGQPAPAFDLRCTLAEDYQAARARSGDFRGQWLLLVFYPRDFSFVCPTELTALSARHAEFADRGCRVVAVSVDPIEIHEEWIEAPPESGGVGPLRFPLASDVDGAVARAYGVYVEDRRVATRGAFLVDPDGAIQYQLVHALGVGRSVDELLRVLDALQSGQLCPVSWTLGDGTIDPSLELHDGRILGRYRIVRELGVGGLGQVFEALDLWLQRRVAIKVLRPGHQADLDFVLSEARAAAALNHPNVCAVYDVAREEGLPVLSMELLTGETLSQRLMRGPMEPAEVLAVARQLADGLAASHAAGVVHGDLKPGNVMVGGDGVVKVLDFGIARRLLPPGLDGTVEAAESPPESDDDDGMVRVTGTLSYLSPERLDGRPAGLPSDVFSFGLLLWEMLLHERALLGDNFALLIFQLRNLDPGKKCAELPAAFRPLVEACLAPDPAGRPRMAEVVEQLAALVSPPEAH